MQRRCNKICRNLTLAPECSVVVACQRRGQMEVMRETLTSCRQLLPETYRNRQGAGLPVALSKSDILRGKVCSIEFMPR
jgi:hypothetical protein